MGMAMGDMGDMDTATKPDSFFSHILILYTFTWQVTQGIWASTTYGNTAKIYMQASQKLKNRHCRGFHPKQSCYMIQIASYRSQWRNVLEMSYQKNLEIFYNYALFFYY